MSRSPNVLTFFLFVLPIGLINPLTIDDSGTRNDLSCKCDHCVASDVMSIESNDPEADCATTAEMNMYTEDFDGDGNRTICARDRDVEDRSFPSICHMLCHNQCTRYSVWIYKVQREKKYIVSAFRTDYYKLRDGPC